MTLSCHHDYYEDLGVSADATSKEITAAYRKLSLQYHPDKHPGLERHYQPIFVKISNAYQVLRDTNKREEYNKIRRRQATKTPHAAKQSSGKPSSSRQQRDHGENARVWEEARRASEKQRQVVEEQKRQAEEEYQAQIKRWKEEWEYQAENRHEKKTRQWEGLGARIAAQSLADDHGCWMRSNAVFEWEPREADELSKSTEQWTK